MHRRHPERESIMKSLLFVGGIILMFAGPAASQAVKSVYTSLSPRNCRTLTSNPDEGGNYEGECRGVSGYKLRVIDGDLRQTIDLIAPGGEKFPLDFWNVSSAFSSVGEKAEWRIRRKIPIALIVRFNANQDPVNPEKVVSYLVVVRISAGLACITDVVPPAVSQNRDARRLADTAHTRPCKFPGG